MSSAQTPRSFDPPRRRPVPTEFFVTNPDGSESLQTVGDGTLIVIVKDNCNGCADFVANRDQILSDLLVVTASRTASETYGALYAPDFITQIDARFAPVYLLAGGSPLEVVTEGTVFSAEQVQAEIAPLL